MIPVPDSVSNLKLFGQFSCLTKNLRAGRGEWEGWMSGINPWLWGEIQAGICPPEPSLKAWGKEVTGASCTQLRDHSQRSHTDFSPSENTEGTRHPECFPADLPPFLCPELHRSTSAILFSGVFWEKPEYGWLSVGIPCTQYSWCCCLAEFPFSLDSVTLDCVWPRPNSDVYY